MLIKLVSTDPCWLEVLVYMAVSGHMQRLDVNQLGDIQRNEKIWGVQMWVVEDT